MYRRCHKQTPQPQPQPCLQGERRARRDQGRVGAAGTAELAEQFEVHPNQIKQWKYQLLDGAADVFDDGRKEAAEPAVDVKNLHTKIGELTLENDFLAGAFTRAGLLSARR